MDVRRARIAAYADGGPLHDAPAAVLPRIAHARTGRGNVDPDDGASLSDGATGHDSDSATPQAEGRARQGRQRHQRPCRARRAAAPDAMGRGGPFAGEGDAPRADDGAMGRRYRRRGGRPREGRQATPHRVHAGRLRGAPRWPGGVVGGRPRRPCRPRCVPRVQPHPPRFDGHAGRPSGRSEVVGRPPTRAIVRSGLADRSSTVTTSHDR